MQGGSGSIQVTNDGATILRSIGVDNPAAKVLVGKKRISLSLSRRLTTSFAATLKVHFDLLDVHIASCFFFRFIARAG